MKCPYCGKEAKLIDNAKIYGRRMGKSYMIYYCENDGARVGTHSNTKRPLGVMASKKLREKRIESHSIIDPLWTSGKMTRAEVYLMLRRKFGKQIHIGEADMKTCKEIIKFFK